MILISVDLPLPFSPARQWISPGRISRLMSRSACTPAKDLLTFLTEMTLLPINCSLFRCLPEEPGGLGSGSWRLFLLSDGLSGRELPGSGFARARQLNPTSESEAVDVVLGDDHPALAFEHLGAALGELHLLVALHA